MDKNIVNEVTTPLANTVAENTGLFGMTVPQIASASLIIATIGLVFTVWNSLRKKTSEEKEKGSGLNTATAEQNATVKIESGGKFVIDPISSGHEIEFPDSSLIVPRTSKLSEIPHEGNLDINLTEKYIRFFRSLSYLELLRSPNNIESRIISGVWDEVISALSSKGFQKHGSVFKSDTKNVEIKIHEVSCPGGISLNIQIEETPIRPLRRHQPDLVFNKFGAIREVIIFLPEPPPIDLDTLAIRIELHIETAYTALEREFINKVIHANRTVFRRVYDHVSVYFKSRGKEHILGKFWLGLAFGNMVLYFFDEDELKRTISHYKNTERYAAFGLSPFQLTCAVLTEAFPFDKTLAFKTLADDKPHRLPWVKAEYIEEAPLIHKAEQLLYGSDDYSALVLCSVRDYHLTTACPTEVESEVMPNLRLIRPQLCGEFKKSMSAWSAYASMITKKEASSKKSVGCFRDGKISKRMI